MISRRNWLLRCTLAGLVLYIFTHISIRSSASDFISELQQSGRNLAALENTQQENLLKTNNNNLLEPILQENSAKASYLTQENNKNNNATTVKSELERQEQIRVFNVQSETKISDTSSNNIVNNVMKIARRIDINDSEKANDLNTVLFDDSTLTTNFSNNNLITTTRSQQQQQNNLPPKSLDERLKELLKCHDRPMLPHTQQRGDYWVLYNYIRAEKQYECYETITYTTHADFTFMDNLVPLVKRWNGPVSVAMHAPGTDFVATVNTIKYLRDCLPDSALVKKFVTFHIFFSTKHVPKQVPKHYRVLNEPYNCSIPVPYTTITPDQMYKAQKKLLYPVNVGRNVARESAQTHFVLPSDIELYPSLNLIPRFLNMIADNKGPLLRKNPRVFVIPVFEVASNYSVPGNKSQLQEMLRNGTAITFHKKVCHSCHNVPKMKEWQAANVTSDQLHVFHIGKRTGAYIHWEPIFVGTHADPLYDERLSWEGKSDKMTQGYALCVLDYDFQILDNAFMCHKPGIKTYKPDAKRANLAAKTNQLIRRIIFPELKILYGIRKGCAV